MAATYDQSSTHSSQSSLSGLPSDDEEVDMRTRAKARRLAEEEEDDEEEEEEEEDVDADGSAEEEEEEVAANESASEDDEAGQVDAEGEEEEDELEDDDDDSEAEEFEEGDGDDYDADKGGTSQKQQPIKTRKPPTRIASNSSKKRKAIAELSRSVSDEDSSPAPKTSASSKKGGAAASAVGRKITLRISPNKAETAKGKKGIEKKEKKPKQSKVTKRRQMPEEQDEEEEEEDEIDDAAEEEADSWDEDFENDESFAQLPKTARQLAKERVNQGADSGSELQELPVEESKKSKLTETEIALRKSEMSRRRRNQTEKKLEDDKIETINKLLKKQVTRRSNREKAGAEESEAELEELEATGTVEKKVVDPRQVRLELKQTPRPFFRYIQGTAGSTLSLPVEEDTIGDQPYQSRWEAMFKKTTSV